MFITPYQWLHWLRPAPPLFPLCWCDVVMLTELRRWSAIDSCCAWAFRFLFFFVSFVSSFIICLCWRRGGGVVVCCCFSLTEVTHSSCTCHVWSPNGNDDALGLVLILTSTTLGPFQHAWIWRRSWTACDSVQTSRGTGTSAFCLSFFFLFPLLPLSC